MGPRPPMSILVALAHEENRCSRLGLPPPPVPPTGATWAGYREETDTWVCVWNAGGLVWERRVPRWRGRRGMRSRLLLLPGGEPEE